VIELAKAAAGEQLQECRLFDVYEGQGMAEGKRSLAIGLIWQHAERTLQEDEVQQWVEAILAQLKEKLGVTLRE
jgi:phenylalanyl-tRNA synthetase beta chain